jgi:hypothetical protein
MEFKKNSFWCMEFSGRGFQIKKKNEILSKITPVASCATFKKSPIFGFSKNHHTRKPGGISEKYQHFIGLVLSGLS